MKISPLAILLWPFFKLPKPVQLYLRNNAVSVDMLINTSLFFGYDRETISGHIGRLYIENGSRVAKWLIQFFTRLGFPTHHFVNTYYYEETFVPEEQ